MSNNIEWVRKPGMTRTSSVPETQEPETKELSDMTIPELREVAEAREVDVSDLRLKADILAALIDSPEPEPNSEENESKGGDAE